MSGFFSDFLLWSMRFLWTRSKSLTVRLATVTAPLLPKALYFRVGLRLVKPW